MFTRMALLLLVTWAGFVPFWAKAMFLSFQTRQVPMDRLFTNLQQRLAQDTNDFETTYDLARLHSMAYSTNLNTIEVRTNNRPEFYYPGSDSGVPQSVYQWTASAERVAALNHLTNAIRLYERAIVLLKRSNYVSSAWLVLPLELGHAWCLDQAGNRQEALKAYRKTLDLAWKQEVTGDFSFSEWVQDKWNAVKSGNNPLRTTNHRGYVGPGVCFSEETIGYMLKLLDPVKDAKEIADLQSRQKTLQTTGRAVTPLLVPTVPGACFSDLVDAHAKVPFDLDGSGHSRWWGWITPQAAWLVFDPRDQGKITSALQMFGNVTFWIFWRDGYAALASLDDDHDGVLRGSELRGLALWQDLNSNGVSDPGEVRSVLDWGVTAIGCRGDLHPTGISWCPDGVTFSDGTTRPTYDWMAPSQASGTESD